MAHGLPGGSAPGGGEDTVDTGEGFAVDQTVTLRDAQIVNDDVPLQDRTLTHLAHDHLRLIARGEGPIGFLLHHKGLDLVIGDITGKHHHQVGGMAVADPTLVTIEYPVITFAPGRGFQGYRIRSVIRFGEGECPDLPEFGHIRQPPLTLLLTAQGVDGPHAEVGVDPEEGVHRTVDASELTCHQACGLSGEPRTAVSLDESAHDAQFRQRAENLPGEFSTFPVVIDDGQDVFFSECTDPVPEIPFLIGEIRIQQEKIRVFGQGGDGECGHGFFLWSDTAWLQWSEVVAFKLRPELGREGSRGTGFRVEDNDHGFAVDTGTVLLNQFMADGVGGGADT